MEALLNMWSTWHSLIEDFSVIVILGIIFEQESRSFKEFRLKKFILELEAFVK